MKARCSRFRIEIFLFTLIFAPTFYPAAVFSQSDHTARLIEGAKKEGRLLWYTALNLQDADMLTKRFEEKYPFIKTQTLRLGTFQPELTKGLNIIATDLSLAEQSKQLAAEYCGIFKPR